MGIAEKDEYMAFIDECRRTVIEELVQRAIWHGAKCLDEIVAYVKANCDYDVGEYIVEEIGEIYEHDHAPGGELYEHRKASGRSR